jgi:hypothetical protein
VIVRLLAALLVLLGLVAYSLSRRLEELEDRQDALVQAKLLETLETRRSDLTRAGQWLHQLYQADEGLQRPGGLCTDGQPDFEGITEWLYKRYLTERLRGASEEEARRTVRNAIRASDEWRRKHQQSNAPVPAGSRAASPRC